MEIEDITIDVVRKNIKNINLRVCFPDGSVRISAPHRVGIDTIEQFAVSKLSWIRKQKVKVKNQNWMKPVEFRNGAYHYFNGLRYSLKIIEQSGHPGVEFKNGNIELHVRLGMDIKKMRALLDGWYRNQLKIEIPGLIEKWENRMGVRVSEFGIKKMTTRWGTCNPRARRIWLNLELAKRPPGCLEYIIVHEMVHLLERKHNARFRAYMDRFMPEWRTYKEILKRDQGSLD